MKKKFLLVLMILFTMVVSMFIEFKSVYGYSSDAKNNGGYIMPDLYNTGPITLKMN